MNQTARASVELTKNDDGTYLNVEIGGRKVAISLNRPPDAVETGVLAAWANGHLFPKPEVKPGVKRIFVLLSECLLAGAVTLALFGVIAGAIWLIYEHAGSLAEGFGAALAAGLLGGGVRYFKTTRRLLHKLTFGSLFK